MIEIESNQGIPEIPIGEEFRVIGEGTDIKVRVREYSQDEPYCTKICALNAVCDRFGGEGFAKCSDWERKDKMNVIYEKI